MNGSWSSSVDFAIAAILFEGVIFDSLNHLDGSNAPRRGLFAKAFRKRVKRESKPETCRGAWHSNRSSLQTAPGSRNKQRG